MAADSVNILCMGSPSEAAAQLRASLLRLNAQLPAGVMGSKLPRVERSASKVVERLRLELDTAGGRARILLTGQIGVGKSSELWELWRQYKHSQSVLAIHCDLEKEMSPERCGALGVLLALFRDAWNSHLSFPGGQQPEGVTDRIFSALVDWLGATKRESGYVFRFGGMDFPVALKQGKSAIVAVALGKAAQHQALVQRDPSEGVIPDRLMALFNEYLRYLKNKTNRDVLLVADHVDKIRSESAARDALIDASSHWGRLDASLVMTAPYEFTLGEMRSSVEGFWRRPLVLYPEPIPELQPPEPLPSFYVQVRQVVGLASLVSDEDLRYLAHYSGGIPRMFILLLSAAVKHAIFAGAARVEAHHTQMAIGDAQADYQDYLEDDLELLDQIVSTQQGLGKAMQLLRSPISLLVSRAPDGASMFRAHPLAERSLRLHRERRVVLHDRG